MLEKRAKNKRASVVLAILLIAIAFFISLSVYKKRNTTLHISTDGPFTEEHEQKVIPAVRKIKKERKWPRAE